MKKEDPIKNSEDVIDTKTVEPDSPSKNKNQIIILVILFVIALFLVLVFILWPKKTSVSNLSRTNEVVTQPDSTKDSFPPKLIIGDPNAKISIVEYADFKCPLCGKFYREIEPQIKKDYIDTGIVNIEYRPLPVISKDSTVAALGAYCSNEQNKFELYHNAVFDFIYNDHYSKNLKSEFADIFTLEKLTQIAAEQGLDSAAFNSCMTSNKYSSAIEASEASAKKDGATGTPTFIIGTQKIAGTQPFSIYKTLIEAQLR